MQSKFCLIGGRYILHDDTVVCTVLEIQYARPLLAKMENLEVEEGTEVALKVLNHLATNGDFSSKIRIPTDTDKVSAKANLVGPPTKYGQKHVCTKCGKKYYNLHGKIDACPSQSCPSNKNKKKG